MSITSLAGLGRITSKLFKTRSANELMSSYAKTGDEATFTALYQLSADRLYYFVLVMCDPSLASDICQKTWVKVIDRRHTYEDRCHFQAWLTTLARRTLIDELRKQARFVYDNDVITQLTGEDEHTESDTLPLNITKNHFHHVLKSLPFKQKEALSLQLDGFSVQDIALICTTNNETIKTRLRYARKALKQGLHAKSVEVNNEI